MKKTLILLFITLAACQSSTIQPNGGIIELKLNETLNIDLGNSNSNITLKKVADSRCPKDATCVRAGEAIASFQLDNQSFDLCIGVECNPEILKDFKTINNLTITLIEVYPLPKTTNGDLAKYVSVRIEN